MNSCFVCISRLVDGDGSYTYCIELRQDGRIQRLIMSAEEFSAALTGAGQMVHYSDRSVAMTKQQQHISTADEMVQEVFHWSSKVARGTFASPDQVRRAYEGGEMSLLNDSLCVCDGCGHEIDPDVCWCGLSEKDHGFSENHFFIPLGCNCYMDKQ